MKNTVLPFILATLSTACGNFAQLSVTPTNSTCQANQAQILVGDGFLKNLCGCTQTAGTQVGPGTSLDCTVVAGTTVFFHYIGTRLKHQIAPTTSGSFVISPPRDPDNANSILAHAVTFQTSGTYGFQDLYFPQLIGQIIVP